MHWTAPTEKNAAATSLENRLWEAADQFRANSGLKAQEYSGPILGLIFLRFAEVRFAAQRSKLDKAGATSRRGSRVDEPAAYHADNVLYLAPEARFDHLLTLPEAADIGGNVNAAMREVEKHNPQLAGVLPKTFNLFTGTLLKELLKKISEIPATLDFDAFGRIYEYFLGEFAMSEGQGGGEVKYTKRYQLGQLVSGLTRNFLLMTATPHNGKEEDCQLFLALLDGDRFEGKFRDGVHQIDTSDLMRRMVKENLLKFDGTPLFPERNAEVAA